MNAEFEYLKQLEIELCGEQARKDKARVAELLHDNFEEFGKSGRVFDKASILEEAPNWNSAKIVLNDFRFVPLSERCILIKYLSDADELRANRSSIWIREQSRWQIIHHQGTPCG